MKYFNYKTYSLNKFFRKLNFRKYSFLKLLSYIKFSRKRGRRVKTIRIIQKNDKLNAHTQRYRI